VACVTQNGSGLDMVGYQSSCTMWCQYVHVRYVVHSRRVRGGVMPPLAHALPR
jgi:hypothetical protein